MLCDTRLTNILRDSDSSKLSNFSLDRNSSKFNKELHKTSLDKLIIDKVYIDDASIWNV